jgi:hypothetical protein
MISRRWVDPGAVGRKASAIKAMMPPSPLLSARVMKVTYFRLTTIISDQKISDRMPRTLSGVIGTGWWAPPKTSLSAYSGLVPMSP